MPLKFMVASTVDEAGDWASIVASWLVDTGRAPIDSMIKPTDRTFIAAPRRWSNLLHEGRGVRARRRGSASSLAGVAGARATGPGRSGSTAWRGGRDRP